MLPFKLLRLSISTLRQYRALPEEQRLALREDAQRVRELTVRLGGSRARQMLAGDGLLGRPTGDRAVGAGSGPAAEGVAPAAAAVESPVVDQPVTPPADPDVATTDPGPADVTGSDPGPARDHVPAAGPTAEPDAIGEPTPGEAETIEELRQAIAMLALSITQTGMVGGNSRGAALGRRLLKSGVAGRFAKPPRDDRG